MYHQILLILCLLITQDLSLALAAPPLSNPTTPDMSSLSETFHTSRCRPIERLPIRPDDCYIAINNFKRRKNPSGAIQGDVTCTADESRHADPTFLVLPDEEVFGSCWVHWGLPRGADATVSWYYLFRFSRELVQQCITDDSFAGVALFGPDQNRVVRFGVVPSSLRGIQQGNGTATERIDIA